MNRTIRFAVLLLLFVAANARADTAQEPSLALIGGTPGQAVTLPLPPDLWRTYVTAVTDRGRPLLFSDNPEYVAEPGIMYRDIVDGPARLYLYHATQGNRVLRYAIVLRNNTDQPVTVTTTRKGVAGPGTGYAAIGQRALERFWTDVLAHELVVPPGEQRHLDPDLIYLAAADNALVHGIYDIMTDGPLEAAFVADDDFNRLRTPDLANYVDFIRPPGERMRGTFSTGERYITFAVGDRPTTLSFAGNTGADLYLFGTDGVDGTNRQNYGNYGVTYHMDVVMDVTEPSLIQLYLSPAYSDAPGCELHAAVMLSHDHHGDNETGHVVRLPASKRQVDAGLVAETVVLPGEPRVLRFDFIPPGGSCLPALLHARPLVLTEDEAAAWYDRYASELAAPGEPEPTTAVAPAGTLFFDDFSAARSHWDFTENPPTHADGHLVIDTFGFTNGIAGPRDWDDYALEARFRVDELGQFGGMRLYVRNQQLWVSYGVFFSPAGVFVDRLEGAWNQALRLAEMTIPSARIKANTWHTARVEVDGTELRVYLDGQPVVTVVDPDNMYPRGNVGFRTENSRVTVDYVRVDPLP